MPRDDLSIDFVDRMPQQESVDPAQILDDFFYRFQNIPEEIRFIQAEITDKDRQVNDCLRLIEDRDAKIQRWIKTNGSQMPNPREDTLRNQIRDNYAKAEKFSDEKLALSKRLQELYDRQILYLDRQIKGLYDRVEPGFNDPDEVPPCFETAPRTFLRRPFDRISPMDPLSHRPLFSLPQPQRPQYRIKPRSRT
ncbi:unnamed protein product [Parascedosporium putredinis]|uniref:Inhibitor of growth protein N-terminal histone-binding domain-containing protein n=1 Tax=Parascedosporium putredinis TaxID=1442378 RepID=A0A9P1H6V8_9PEZI|nr:unnamed protein product [Parascedosporium putredinis]CAI7998998.1 unnamed protein product [Parascedosporium putredinis]